jgi:hypothetical protein
MFVKWYIAIRAFNCFLERTRQEIVLSPVLFNMFINSIYCPITLARYKMQAQICVCRFTCYAGDI